MRALNSITLALVLAGAVGCRSVDRIKTECGEVIVAEGEYTVVMLSPTVLNDAFGPEWSHQRLFYKQDKVILTDGVGRVAGPMRPIAVGTPVIVLPGSRWDNLHILVYSLESDVAGWFVLDTVARRLEVEGASRKLGRRPVLQKDGTLYIGEAATVEGEE